MKPKSDRTLDRLLDDISPIEQAKTDAKMMLAARIADTMKAKKWKNKELLAAVGKTNPSIITKWLSGTHNFTVDTLVELEEALGISLINLEEKEQEIVMTYHFVIRKEVQPYSEADDFNETMVLEDQESQHFNKEFTLHYNNMEKTEQIVFQIKAIELLDSSISAPNKPFSGKKVFRFDISVKHLIYLEKRLIKVICNVTVLDESKESIFGNIRTGCLYEIQDMPEYYNEKEKRVDLPEQFITSVTSVSISTTRGVMFTFFRGTFLHNAVLPVIDPKGFISKNQ